MSLLNILGCNCLTKKESDNNVNMDIISIDIVEGKSDKPEDIRIKIEIGFNIPRPGVQRGDFLYLKMINESSTSIEEIEENLIVDLSTYAKSYSGVVEKIGNFPPGVYTVYYLRSLFKNSEERKLSSQKVLGSSEAFQIELIKDESSETQSLISSPRNGSVKRYFNGGFKKIENSGSLAYLNKEVKDMEVKSFRDSQTSLGVRSSKALNELAKEPEETEGSSVKKPPKNATDNGSSSKKGLKSYKIGATRTNGNKSAKADKKQAQNQIPDKMDKAKTPSIGLSPMKPSLADLENNPPLGNIKKSKNSSSSTSLNNSNLNMSGSMNNFSKQNFIAGKDLSQPNSVSQMKWFEKKFSKTKEGASKVENIKVSKKQKESLVNNVPQLTKEKKLE